MCSRGGLSPRLVLGAVATLSALLTTATSDTYFRGEGTVYTLSNPTHGNCNFMAYPDDAVVKYAALNTPQWDATRNCGRCAEVSCTDARCAGATKSAEVVHIVDQCPGCAAGDLDLSPTVFKAITGLDSDRLSIKWKFVDCPVASRIKFCLKKGSNAFWAAIQPTNFVAGVASVRVNGQATTMVDSAYYFLLDGKSETTVDLSKLRITVIGLNGEVIDDTVSFASSDCVEGAKQFTPGTPDLMQPAPAPIASLSRAPSPTPALQQAQSSVVPIARLSPTPEPPALWTQATALPPATQSPTTAASSEGEVGGAADPAAGWDGDIERQVSPATPAPTADDSVVNAVLSPSNDTTGMERIRTETRAESSSTSPEVVALSAFGCVGAVVLVALAAYVNKKKLDDKRADADHSSSRGDDYMALPTHALALTSQNSSAPSGSFCQVLSPCGERRSLNFAVL
ncbi:hypothetical protein PybrP1_012230 [[Pythium] brassicae (nom. inval.)]|nr:hypothetical protein PybrP1_012230 [[Pythium] brassicae (nom. inval.)]